MGGQTLTHSIQLDMFEVQLGAGLLLQFRTPRGTVRVLADAGVDSSYPPDHVHKKLSDRIPPGSDGLCRIDLVIGTHYDADHLKGMVDIIKDGSIEIGEAWLPPVANDTEYQEAPAGELEPHSLAAQLAGSNGRQVLGKYLLAKANSVELRARDTHEVARFESIGMEPRVFSWARRSVGPSFQMQYQEAVAEPGELSSTKEEDEIIVEAITWFAQRLAGMDEHQGSSHADDPTGVPEAFELADQPVLLRRGDGAALDPAKLNEAVQHIRKSEVKDAINAAWLARIVGALKSRSIPIQCINIEDGEPERFVWSVDDQRFVKEFGADLESPLTLHLLGPSKGLVRKHWERLPIGAYAQQTARRNIPIRGITPSNQLSYIATFEFQEQRILVCGDAGCVDFKPTANGDEYYEALVAGLKDLNVVQVAHHAGNNAHYYRVLEAAGITDQERSVFFLLSHAVNDKHRPSEVFADFMRGLGDRSGDRLLFTSQPRSEKVGTFLSKINDVTGTPSDRGDVILVFDRSGWSVSQHLVQVKPA